MNNKELFTRKALHYTTGRSGYAQDAVEMILKKMLRQEDSIADIGSGTGVLSKEFFQRGFETYCVEPNEAMRNEAERQFGEERHFHSVDASAEDTGLADHSIQLVTAASAFHWFDASKFKAECKRILVPGGIVCILMNVREYDPFTWKQHEICQKYCANFTSLAHGYEKIKKNLAGFFENGYETAEFSFPIWYTKEKFIARSLSSSYAPTKDSDNYEGYIAALKELLDVTTVEEKIGVKNLTVMMWGRL